MSLFSLSCLGGTTAGEETTPALAVPHSSSTQPRSYFSLSLGSSELDHPPHSDEDDYESGEYTDDTDSEYWENERLSHNRAAHLDSSGRIVVQRFDPSRRNNDVSASLPLRMQQLSHGSTTALAASLRSPPRDRRSTRSEELATAAMYGERPNAEELLGRGLNRDALSLSVPGPPAVAGIFRTTLPQSQVRFFSRHYMTEYSKQLIQLLYYY